MLSEIEVIGFFRDLESDRVERKRDFVSSSDKIRQAICAFANDLPNHGQPGIIIVGQNDNGSCANIDVSDELLKTMAGIRSEGKILPFPVMSVSRYNVDGCIVAAIIVAPSSHPPVRLDGRCWVRIGPLRGTATVEEEKRLSEKQIWQNLTFDARPCTSATFYDIDLFRFEAEYLPAAMSPEILRQNGRTSQEKMQALRLLSRDNVPTNAAILLLGKDPRTYFPGAYIQFLRIDGSQLTDEIIDQKEINGTLPDQVRQIEEVLKLNIRTRAAIGGPRRLEQSDYPMQALEQLVRNAILHRTYDSSTMPTKVYWYADRIEIMNPGGLYGEVTPYSIWKNATSYRNPAVAEGLKNLGVVDRFGFGLIRAKQALKENGNPELRFEFQENFVLMQVGPVS
jgi:ATP-dependent DNA helicase RecG